MSENFTDDMSENFKDDKFLALPAPDSVRLIDYENAEVLGGWMSNNTFFLTVSGTKPYVNMSVDLRPAVYVRQPEYWEINVLGYMSGIGEQQDTPYITDPLSLCGITGTKGIRVVGANKREWIVVPPK
jgi:hypothetical protein